MSSNHNALEYLRRSSTFSVDEQKEQLMMPKFNKLSQQIMEFDMNTIFQLSYSFDVLKKVIDRIVVEVDTTNDKYGSIIDKLITKVNSHEQKISQTSKSIDGV